jgi:hypothetical protein
VKKLGEELARGEHALQSDSRTGYLRSLLDALNLSPDSQLLVFSKTGVQSAFSGPQHPRALYFDESVVVGYIPGAPLIEIATHDPQQGVVFYTINQRAEKPTPKRQMTCLTCHVSATTLGVPGMIARSNIVGDDGNVMPRLGGNDVNHQTPHADRWGGWFVTSEGVAPPYAQRAHEGNITFTTSGNTSNQVFVDWLDRRATDEGYLSESSDIVALQIFDHEMYAINLLTKMNWEARIEGANSSTAAGVAALANQLADYLLFVGEAPLASSLTARPAFAARLASRTPKDRRGRSFGQLELVDRLFKYPCSFMIYSDAFDGLPALVKRAVYERMMTILSGGDKSSRYANLSAESRRAILEILRDTKPDFTAS